MWDSGGFGAYLPSWVQLEAHGAHGPQSWQAQMQTTCPDCRLRNHCPGSEPAFGFDLRAVLLPVAEHIAMIDGANGSCAVMPNA